VCDGEKDGLVHGEDFGERLGCSGMTDMNVNFSEAFYLSPKLLQEPREELLRKILEPKIGRSLVLRMRQHRVLQ
jgi:hypothetical protein